MDPRVDVGRRKVWDAPTRLFHWTLVLLIVLAWMSHRFSETIGDGSLRWHRVNGYMILILIVFRLIWGFFGSQPSQFSAFLRNPFYTFNYASDTIRGRSRHFLGHNPLGSYMVVALLLGLTCQALFGLFLVDADDINAGPLHNLVSDEAARNFDRLHHIGFKLIEFLVVVHIIANSLYGLVKHDPLILAMIKGYKPAGDYEDFPGEPVKFASRARALIVLACSAAIVLGGIKLLGNSL